MVSGDAGLGPPAQAIGGIVGREGFRSQAEVADNVRRAAGFLRGQDVAAGDTVALLLRNSALFVEITMAAQHIGAYPVPINWHFAPPEVAYCLADCGARVLFCESDLVPTLEPLPAGVLLIAVGGHQGGEGQVLAHDPIETEPLPPMQSIVYTSGTTGRPKGVRRAPATDDQAREVARVRQRVYQSRPGMRTLVPAPMYHSAPNMVALLTARAPGLLVVPERFDAAEVLALIERHRITHVFMVPTMFIRLLSLPEEVKARFDPSSLESVLHAGAPCPPQVKQAMIDWWGPVINEFYGSTEMSALVFVTAPEAIRRPGTVGRVLDGITLRIRDEEGRECPQGTAGEIFVARTVYPDFTYHRADDKRAELEREGEIATGDAGYFDEDGYLFLCDRVRDMVISGGVNIYPAEIESALALVPGVHDAAVFGVPDDEFGEAVVAVVQPSAGATLTEGAVAAALEGRLARYKIPRRIVFAPVPRDDNGKLFKRKLREAFPAIAG